MSGTSFASRAAGLNAATLAILDAGSIALRAVPIAVALAVLPSGLIVNGDGNGGGGRGVLVVDPDLEEEQRATSRHVFGWAFGAGISTAPVTKSSEGEVDQGMEVDDELGEGAESELVWAESEGSFSRKEVR